MDVVCAILFICLLYSVYKLLESVPYESFGIQLYWCLLSELLLVLFVVCTLW